MFETGFVSRAGASFLGDFSMTFLVTFLAELDYSLAVFDADFFVIYELCVCLRAF